MEDRYDVVIVGAGFSGLTLAHHLPENFKILILERKSDAGAAVESTGLITTKTKELLSFVKVDNFITNKITTIGVVSPDYERYFFSKMETPWIYSTDTPRLVKEMAQTLKENSRVKYGCNFKKFSISRAEQYTVQIDFCEKGEEKRVFSRFIVGADGARSAVASSDSFLSHNRRFLVGLERVFFGRIEFGPEPIATVYHFWFGDFSLGYGGWLSPTIINGRQAFRVGLAKLENNAKDLSKLDEFIKILKEKGIVKFDEEKPVLSFGNYIPIGGPLKNFCGERVLLLGDAAGLCGAFAADGIKGAVISGKVGATIIQRYLSGDTGALRQFYKQIQSISGLMTYYKKQMVYRFIWNRMKRNRTFQVMFDIIATQKERFLHQFCDSKDRNRSLLAIALQPRQLLRAALYSLYIIIDAIV